MINQVKKCRDETKGFRTEEVCDLWPKKGWTAERRLGGPH